MSRLALLRSQLDVALQDKERLEKQISNLRGDIRQEEAILRNTYNERKRARMQRSIQSNIQSNIQSRAATPAEEE